MTEHGMNKRSIEKHLNKKFYEFVDSIEDEEVRKLVLKDTIITGGCIASMLLGEKINDYDLYFRNKNTTLAIAKYYAEKAEVTVSQEGDRILFDVSLFADERGGTNVEYGDVAEEDLKPYRPIYVSPNAITLSDDIQIVVRFYGPPKEIHKNFDFVHATNYWRSSNGELTLNKKAMESLLCKNLRYVGSKYPVCSVIRIRKFISRGWIINAGQILKILLQVSDLDLTNYDVLREQLIGIDTAYFAEVLELMNKGGMETIDTTYLMKIIDQVFE